MKKVISWILAITLTAALAVGGTLAYLTDTDEDVNVMTVGQVKIDQLEYERVDTETKDDDAEVQVFHDNKPLYPGVYEEFPGTEDTYVDWEQIGKEDYTSNIWNPDEVNNEVDKMVFVKNKGDYDAYVRSVLAFEAGNYETLDEYLSMVHLNLNETEWTWEWMDTPVTIGENKYFVATATYNDILAPGALTEINLSQILLDKTATNEDVEAFGDTFQVLVKSQAIQADGFDDPDTALNEGFGEISEENIPWEDDDPIKGIDMWTAIHTDNDDITVTKKVTKVVFGLNEDYPEVIENYEGRLVDKEQDVPVYAYHVEDTNGYTVYLLASDVIYTPKDSKALLKDMSALVTVDTYNMDVSRTQILDGFVQNCSNLQQIDVSHWDTSNATSLHSTFRNCKKLQKLDVSNWDVSDVTTMYALFMDMQVVEELDVSQWETGKVTNMTGLFNHCYALTELAVEDWDVSNSTTFQLMFGTCKNVTSLDLSKWNPCKVTNMNQMFLYNYELEQLNMEGWNLAALQSCYDLVGDCYKLEVCNLSGWNTPSLVTFNNLFHDCNSLKELDFSTIDTRNVTNMKDLLQNCFSLEKITLGEKFSVDGNGTCTVEANTAFVFTNATSVEGWDGKWYNAATGEPVVSTEVPDETAAVYVSVKPAE